jgi:hypothetical protein
MTRHTSWGISVAVSIFREEMIVIEMQDYSVGTLSLVVRDTETKSFKGERLSLLNVVTYFREYAEAARPETNSPHKFNNT